MHKGYKVSRRSAIVARGMFFKHTAVTDRSIFRLPSQLEIACLLSTDQRFSSLLPTPLTKPFFFHTRISKAL